eukprot:m.124893 g.124893  ORF g.124893 m.124893 type:complete len:396 (+) comp29088_c0_seq1:99-1286(+)
MASFMRAARTAVAMRPSWPVTSIKTSPRCMSQFTHANLVIEKTQTPQAKPAPNTELGFGNLFSDHMLVCNWTIDDGWEAPKIEAMRNLSLSPAAMCLHYGLECFEGMKAYRGVDNKVRLFRPDLNVKRFNKSSRRFLMPTVDEVEFKKCLAELVKLDADWIPEGRGQALYLRPTMIATAATLGVKPSPAAMMFVITSPVGAYYAGDFRPIRLFATAEYARAWPGGVGDAKCGGNYAPTIMVQQQAANEHQCDQILWLLGDDEYVTEAGTSNFFVHWINEQGVEEIVTAPLDGIVLEGVTRQAVIDILNGEDIGVTERVFKMDELVKAIDEGRVKELFSSGTAVTICPIKEILYKGKLHKVDIPEGGAGPNTKKLTKTIFDIMYGVTPHEWAPVIA